MCDIKKENKHTQIIIKKHKKRQIVLSCETVKRSIAQRFHGVITLKGVRARKIQREHFTSELIQ